MRCRPVLSTRSNAALTFAAALLTTTSVACKTLAPSTLASSQPPTSGERIGKQSESRVTIAGTPNVQNTLTFRIWSYLSKLNAEQPSLVGCKNVDGGLPTRECATYDPATSADFVYCFAQSTEGGTSGDQFDPGSIDNIYCSFTSTTWPRLSSYLANTVLGEMLAERAAGATSVNIGATKKMLCSLVGSQWQCEYDGFGSQVQDYVAARLIVRPSDFGDLTPGPNATDELDRLLPSGSRVAKVNLKGGAVLAKTYKSTDDQRSAMLAYLPDESESEFAGRLEDIEYTSDCKNPEIYALMDYTLEGYRDVNAALRNLYANPNAEVDAVVDARVRTTLSGTNCARQTSAGVVVRGANLSPEKLARYQPGAFIVEPAFTSTTIGEDVRHDFQGNVFFQIFDAKGADLTNLSMLAEEGEAEMLIQAGSLFKVLSREVDGELTIIKMVYIP